jgi:nucleotide-binding universal stress UspA family protein
MKTILIATDFSPASKNATTYGMELAKEFNSRVVLFGAWHQIAYPVMESTVIESLEDIERLTKEALEQEAKHYANTYNLKVDGIYKEGNAADLILETAEEIKAGLIVAGMKQAAKGFGMIFGSTATTLARHSGIPLLIVPEETRYDGIGTIALANETDLEFNEDPQELSALHELAEHFHSKLYLVRVAKDRFKEAFEILNRPFRLTRMLKGLDTIYEPIEGKNIPEALNGFIRGYKVNLLAMLPHKQSLMERWFVKSTTRAMILQSPVSLLILPQKTTTGKTAKGTVID